MQDRRYEKIADSILINITAGKFEIIMDSIFRKHHLNNVVNRWPNSFVELLRHYENRDLGLPMLYDDLVAITPTGQQDNQFTARSFPQGHTKRRLNILYITGMFPSLEHGGGLRIFDILMKLTTRHNVDLYSVYSENLDRKSFEIIKDRFGDMRLTMQAIPNIKDIAEWLENIGKDNLYYDVVQLEYPTTIYLAEHVRKYGKKVGFTFMEATAKSAAINVNNHINDSNSLGESLVNFLHCARYEKSISEKVDFSVCVTDEDASFIKQLSGITPYVIPTCVSDYVFNKWNNREQQPIEYSAAYVGYFDHPPNVDAVKWYYKEIHQKVKNAIPNFKLLIIGRGNIQDLKELTKDDPSISYTGPVDDISDYIAKANICISPLISGAGIRGKINQYSYLGKPSVSTTIGLCGTPYVHGKSVLRADDPDEFAAHMITLLLNEDIYAMISKECRDIAFLYFGWDREIEKLESLYHM